MSWKTCFLLTLCLSVEFCIAAEKKSMVAFPPESMARNLNELEQTADAMGSLFLEGMLKASSNGISINNVVGCVTDTASVGLGIASGVLSICSGDPLSIASGILGIINSVVHIPAAFIDCVESSEEVIGEIIRLIVVLKNFKKPDSIVFGPGLAINGVEIHDELENFTAAWNSKQFLKAGEYFGQALTMVHLQSQTTPSA